MLAGRCRLWVCEKVCPSLTCADSAERGSMWQREKKPCFHYNMYTSPKACLKDMQSLAD